MWCTLLFWFTLTGYSLHEHESGAQVFYSQDANGVEYSYPKEFYFTVLKSSSLGEQ